MKILGTAIQNNTIQNLYHTLMQIGHQIVLWNPKQTSLYGIVDKYKPDLFFCHNEITPTTLEAIQEYNIPTVTFGLTLPFEQQKLICTLNKIPDVIKKTIQTQYYECLPAANITYNLETFTPCDLIYVCDAPIEPTILSYIEAINQLDLSLKIVGNIKIPFYSYVGNVTTEEKLSLCKTAKITILNNMTNLYDLAFYGSFTLSNQQNPLYPSFTNPEDLLNNVKYYLDQPKTINKIIKEAYKIAVENTYHHRLIDIFKLLNYTEEIEICQNHLLKALES